MDACRTLTAKECDDMKKYLLALILVLVMAGTAQAGTVVVVDGDPVYMETVNIDDHLYMPLRALGEALGVDIQWDGSMVSVKTAKRPTVTGGDAASRTYAYRALDLLRDKDRPDYRLVCEVTKEIKISDSNLYSKDGHEAYALTNAVATPGIINLSPKLMVKSPEYVAAMLTHEACHLAGSVDSETNSYIHEMATLQILNASQGDMDEAQRAMREATQ